MAKLSNLLYMCKTLRDTPRRTNIVTHPATGESVEPVETPFEVVEIEYDRAKQERTPPEIEPPG